MKNLKVKKLVLNFILQMDERPFTTGMIANTLGIPYTSVVNVMRFLKENNFIVRQGEKTSEEPGRPMILYVMTTNVQKLEELRQITDYNELETTPLEDRHLIFQLLAQQLEVVLRLEALEGKIQNHLRIIENHFKENRVGVVAEIERIKKALIEAGS